MMQYAGNRSDTDGGAAMIEKTHTFDIWSNSDVASQSSGPIDQIDKRDKLSRKEFLHEYVLKNRPVVLKDAARSWKALGKWTPAFFRERYGERKVPVFERKR